LETNVAIYGKQKQDLERARNANTNPVLQGKSKIVSSPLRLSCRKPSVWIGTKSEENDNKNKREIKATKQK